MHAVWNSTNKIHYCLEAALLNVLSPFNISAHWAFQRHPLLLKHPSLSWLLVQLYSDYCILITIMVTNCILITCKAGTFTLTSAIPANFVKPLFPSYPLLPVKAVNSGLAQLSIIGFRKEAEAQTIQFHPTLLLVEWEFVPEKFCQQKITLASHLSQQTQLIKHSPQGSDRMWLHCRVSKLC